MFKQIILYITVLFTATSSYTQHCAFTPIKVYVVDKDNETNIRATPNGNIVLKLNHEQNYYSLKLIGSKKEWFKIKTIVNVDGDTLKIPNDMAWIHRSVIEATTRKNIELLDAPINGNLVGTIEQETGISILDVCSDWVKIEYKGLRGWVEAEWLCGNPVTTCP